MINYLLDRFYYKTGIRLLLDALWITALYPILRLVYRLYLGVDTQISLGRAVHALCVAPWWETLFIFVPIIELLRCTRVKSWVIVLAVSIPFGFWHSSFTLGFYFGVVWSSLYVVTRRFSIFHAFLYTTICHFLYNLFSVFVYRLVF